MFLLLLVILLVLCLGGLPGVGYDHGMGYYPSSGLGLILLILLILMLAGRI